MAGTPERIRGTIAWAWARASWYRGLEELSPVAFCYWNSRFPERHVVSRDCDLVVEGYPAAANTWVREVLQLTQPGLRVASHLHSVAHLERARQLGVPAVVLLRPPVESVSSLLARFPGRGFTPEGELRRYERFYRGVDGFGDAVLLARFDDVVSTVSHLIQAINDKFGLALVPIDGEPELQRRVFDVVDGWSQVLASDRFEALTPRPSEARAAAAARAREAVLTCDPRMLAECEELYRELAGRSCLEVAVANPVDHTAA